MGTVGVRESLVVAARSSTSWSFPAHATEARIDPAMVESLPEVERHGLPLPPASRMLANVAACVPPDLRSRSEAGLAAGFAQVKDSFHE